MHVNFLTAHTGTEHRGRGEDPGIQGHGALAGAPVQSLKVALVLSHLGCGVLPAGGRTLLAYMLSDGVV